MPRSATAISIEVAVVDGFETHRGREDLVVDLRVPTNMRLSQVHATLVSIMRDLQQSQEEDEDDEDDEDEDEDEMNNGTDFFSVPENLNYFLASDPDCGPLDHTKTIEELNIREGDRLIAQQKKRSKRARPLQDKESIIHGEGTIVLMCTTRIFENEGVPQRRLRVLAHKQQSCSLLMDDIAALWNKNGMKFRYGRTVLVANKTFEEQGIHSDGEVVVTGGRGN